MRHYPTLGERLHYARRLSGYTQGALARQAGVTDRYIKYLEKNEKTPRDKTLIRLANVLHVTPEYLKRGAPPA